MPKELTRVLLVILSLVVGCTAARGVDVGGRDAASDSKTDGTGGAKAGTGGRIDAGPTDAPGAGGSAGALGSGGSPADGGTDGGMTGAGGATGTGGTTGAGGSCQSPRTQCASGCVDVTSDPANCGTCEKTCTAPTGGTPICSARVCDFTCPGKKCGTTSCVGASQCCTVNDCTAPTGGTVMCLSNVCVPSCTSGLTVCGSACVDLAANDAANCGRCGRSCLGGTCSAGVCQPVRLGGAFGGRFNEAGSSAIFSSGYIGAGAATRIGTIPKAGAAALTVFLQTNPDVAGSIALDPAGTLYFVDNDTIRNVPFADGAMPSPSGASVQLYPAAGVDNSGEFDRFRTDSILFGTGSDLQLTGGRLVFVTQSIPSGTTHLLKSVTTAGAGVVTLVASGFDGAFATQGGNAFYYQTPPAASAFIGQIDAAGATTPIHLANIISGRPNAMTSDGTYVVFATAAVLQRMKTGLDLQVPETIYSGTAAETVMGVLADATNFYWIVNTSLGAPGGPPCSSVHIYKKPKGEAAAVAGILIGSQADVNTVCASGELTQDATAIYLQLIGGSVSGPIYQLAK